MEFLNFILDTKYFILYTLFLSLCPAGRQSESECRAFAPFALKSDRPAVLLHDEFRDIEPQAGADLILGFGVRRAEEFAEDILLFAVRNADARVAHDDLDLSFLNPFRHEYLVAAVGIFERILDDVLEDDADLFFVKRKRRRKRVGLQENDLDALAVRFAGEIEDRLFDELGQVVRLEDEIERRVFGVVEREHFIDEKHHALGRGERFFHEIILFLRDLAEIAVEEHFQDPFHRRERCAELVRGNRNPIGLDLVHPLQLLILFPQFGELVFFFFHYGLQYNKRMEKITGLC